MKRIKNWLKARLRKALGIPALEETIQQLGSNISELEKNLAAMREELTEQHIQLMIAVINSSKSGSVFSCQINGMELLAPVELLRLYPHCIYPSSDKKLTYFIEKHQSEWLCSRLKPGDVALDIGAGYGVITIALSRAVGEWGAVYSFEPAKTTQKFLQNLLELNDISNVTIVNAAISDTCGSTDFIEYTSENQLSWAADASTLALPTVKPSMENYLCYSVNVTTIDDYVARMGIQPNAIKIDIEGFELYALNGGKRTLEEFSPYLCVDIHKDVKTGKSALLGVQPYLAELGYDIEMKDHAIYAHKPDS